MNNSRKQRAAAAQREWCIVGNKASKVSAAALYSSSCVYKTPSSFLPVVPPRIRVLFPRVMTTVSEALVI